MKFLVIFCFTCLFAVGALAQRGATLHGQVTICGVVDKTTAVQLINFDNPQISLTVETNDVGTYRFENVPAGKYFIRFGDTKYGPRYDVFDKAPLVLSDGETRGENLSYPSDCRMHEWPALPDIPQVFISAGSQQPIDEVSKSVSVISGQEMRDRADFTLVDSLRSIPGFRVQQLGGFGKTASIKTRGLRNQDTAILIDGIRFRDATSITGDATPFLSDFTLTSVSKIEVLRGSDSSLYGTNAIGGVVDFQTPEPQKDWHGQVSGAAGGLGLGRFRGNVSKSFGDLGFITGLSRTVYTKGIDGDDDANNTNFQSKLVYDHKNSNFSGRLFFSDAFVRLNSNPDTLGPMPLTNAGIIDAREAINFTPDADDPDDTQKSRFFDAQFVFTRAAPKWVFQTFYSGLKTRRKNSTGPLGVGFQSASFNLFDGLINTANAHFDWLPTTENRMTVGYEFEHEKFRNDSSSAFSSDLSTVAKQSSNSIYLQYLLGLIDGRLQLAGGFRAQFFDLAQPRFTSASPLNGIQLARPPAAHTFDGAASYYFRSAKTKIRAHVGNGYRIPSLFERFASFFGAFHPDHLFLAGAPNLKPERSIAADAGIEQSAFKEKLRLTATYFYTKLSRAIGYALLPQPDPFGRSNSETFGGYQNTDGFISRGSEFSGTLRPTRSTDIFASYTLTNSDQRTPQVAGSGVIETLGIPKHQFTLVVTQRIEDFWVNLDLLIASDYLAPIFSSTTFNSYVYRFGGNRRGDVTAGYVFRLGGSGDRSLRVFGTVENIFNDKYFENGFKTPRANARFGVSFGF
jgi:iron complex outermembrane receptor protein